MPYVLPTPEPRRRWYNDVGESQGLTARILLAMLTGGASGGPSFGKSPTTPTAQNPGQIQFPSGAQTTTSPMEQAMIQQMGGAPTTRGDILPSNQISYQPPVKWGFQQGLDAQAKQQQIDQGKIYSDYIKSLTAGGSAPTTGGTLSPATQAYLAKRALAGDTEADAILQQHGF